MKRWALGACLVLLVLVPPLGAQANPAAGTVGEGPFSRLILRGVNLIDGTGAPAQGMYNLYGFGYVCVGGVRYTLKNGVLFDGEKLRAEIRRMVAEAKHQ